MNIKSLYIELTNQCNFRCETCYNRSGLLKPEFLTWDTLHSLLNKLPSKAVSFAGGEPLLYPHRDALIEYIAQHPNRTFSFVTNGSIDWILPYYKELPNLQLQVSLDGSCEEINALTRGAGHYAATADFIQKAAAIRPLTGKMVINGHNCDDVEAYYRLITGWGCKPVFSFVNNAGSALEHWGSMELSPAKKVQILKRIEALNEEFGIDTPVPYCTHHCPLQDPDEPWNLLITSDGRIQPCQSLYDSQFTLSTIYELTADHNAEPGNDPFASLDARMDEIQSAAEKRRETDYNCYRCLIRSKCDHGCSALAFNYHQDFMACDEQCDFRRQQFLLFLKKTQKTR